MRLLNLIIAIATILPLNVFAIDMIRENVAWNYYINDIYYDYQPTKTDDYGYHFEGTRQEDGKTYSVFLNGNGEEVALMRQDGGKTFLHLSPEMKKCMEGYDEFTEIYGPNPTEMLIYNFDAKVGDSYYMPVFFPESDDFELFTFFVVGLNEVCINGEMMTFQSVAPSLNAIPYTIVEGIGPDHGKLHRPQLGCLIPSMSYSYAFIDNVKDCDGKVLFSEADFKHCIHTRYIVDEFEIWEYSGNTGDRDFSYRMFFDGAEILDGKLYHTLHTANGKQSWLDSLTTTFQSADIENGLTFYMREEDGKVYLHAPLGTEEEGYPAWSIDAHEALLYDFNARKGDEMTVISSSGNLMTGKVTSIISTNVDGHDYNGYTIKFNTSQTEFTVMERMGNIGSGCLPYFIEHESESTYSSELMTYVPVCFLWQSLDRVLNRYPESVICEKDADGLWPWEKTDGVAELEAASQLSFDGRTVVANDEHLTIYAISGKVVAEGCGKISTESLQPGVYVAKAGTKTLKILVK